jgi:hypothetical protein
MRKNIFILALLFCCGFSLAAQSHSGASIYVSPVTGNGSKPEDNSLFYRQLTSELTGQDFKMANTQNGADFSLIGTLAPYGGGQYVFHLGLQDNKTAEVTVEGELLYGTADDINHLFPVLVSSLLYTIPEAAPVKNDEWRNKWLYFGAAAIWTPRFYLGGVNRYFLQSILGGFSVEFHFLNFMSFETGAELAVDRVNLSDTDFYQNPILEVPLLFKYVIMQGSLFMFEPYAGAQINIPFLDKPYTTRPPLFSGVAGFQSGVKAGPGAVFFDMRLAIDFGKLILKSSVPDLPAYQRLIFHFGLGYKYGILQRKPQ